MNRYKQLHEKFIYKNSKNNRKIFDTNHSIDRFKDRKKFNITDKEFRDKIIWVINNAIKKIIIDNSDESGNYGIHSKSTGIGLVVDWRKDTQRRDDQKNHAFIVTLLPIRQSHTFRDVIATLFVEQLIEWAKNKYKKQIKLEENTTNIVKEYNLSVIFWEGEYYDNNLLDIIIVD